MLRSSMIAALLLGSAAAPAAIQRTTPSFTSEAARAPGDVGAMTDTLPFASDSAKRMTVMVKVDGQGPFAFLVDTGSERTSISRQLATRLGLRGGIPTRVHSVLGSKTVATVHIPRLAVGKQALSVINAPIFEVRHLGAVGMLGIDSLQSQRLEFDFKGGEINIAPTRYEAIGVIDKDTVVVRARARNGRLILTSVTLDGIAIAAIIDTGAEVSIGNLPLMRRLQRSRGLKVERVPIRANPERAIIEAVTGQVGSVALARVQHLDLGGVEVNNVMVAFANARIFKELGYGGNPAILLGIDALRSFDKVSIDFAQKKVRFVVPTGSTLNSDQIASR